MSFITTVLTHPTRRRRRKQIKRHHEIKGPWYLYVLEGEQGTYVGITANFQLRMLQHEKGDCMESAALGDPAMLTPIYLQNIGSYKEALTRENKLKAMTEDKLRAMVKRSRHKIKSLPVIQEP